jgi:quercetin dioxygenase-like cupin family protein
LEAPVSPGTRLTAFLFFLLFAGVQPAAAADYKRVEPLVTTGRTIIGETILYPTGAAAKIDSLIVSMEPGESTGWHKHGVPIYGYILEGELTVDYGDKGTKVYPHGTGFMEAMDHWHNGHNHGDVPARVLVVFMGAEGIKNTIAKE